AIDFFFKKSGASDGLPAFVKKVLDENLNELDLNPLTRLPGFRSTVLKVERANQSGAPFSILSVDLRNLGAYNKLYGDARGDEVIIELSRILKDTLKRQGSADDFLGHLGGDDFILVTAAKMSVPIAERVVERFDEVIPRFYHEKNQRQDLMTVSVVIMDGERGRPIEVSRIGSIAGKLKQHTKTLSGSCYVKYHARPETEAAGSSSPSVKVRIPGQSRSVQVPAAADDSDKYAAFFRRLIEERRIRTVYQPLVDMKNKAIIGYEALTRSAAGDKEVEPSHLFEMARDSGKIKELDRLCVECALETGQALGPGKKLFLNLNQETLLDTKLIKELFHKRGRLDFKNFVIEVTEQSILRSFDSIRESLMELKNQGVAVAIDDVGGGAVSLRDVTVLKPDYIKFDRSLVRQIDADIPKQQIILSMILFADGIEATTVAEGIETRKEYEALKICGIHLGQGYYFAKPGPAFPEVTG
ncbi:MAG: EAL domain-containing protein, partial [Candidatus Omnitrophica bacterium]|nr:EAL domain-containing protein [Candidatus Omnitrophota bacterium]